MVIKVCKFGGTSLATRAQIEKSLDIMIKDANRKFMIVSAPGSRFKGDTKVTDLLIHAAMESKKRGSAEVYFSDRVIERFQEIIPDEHTIISDLRENLKSRLSDTKSNNYGDSVKAFGEYASAIVVNNILSEQRVNSTFFDPLEMGFIIAGKGKNARPDSSCYERIHSFFKNKEFSIVVIPGFYGYNKKAEIITLPRGGSDTSGAVIARGVGAEIYENWTDEDGLRRADPRVVGNAETIPEMTYDEARELAYMGFKLQDACFEPLKGNSIVLNVRNTNNPNNDGTKIVDFREVSLEERIVGVACQKDFVSIGMRKMYIDREVGFGRKAMNVFEEMKIPYEHTLDGVDTTSFVVASKYLKEDKLRELGLRLKRACRPNGNLITYDMAIVSVAGLGMKNHYDVHARAFSALAREKIAIKMIDEGADDLSLFFGVDNDRANDAVNAVYTEFYPSKNNS
jgi:aspartate kinase